MDEITDWESLASYKGLARLYSKTAYRANESPRTNEERLDVAKAKRVCIACPVRSACLEDAMTEEAYLGGLERHGIRGGLTARERVLIAAQDPLCARCKVNEVVPAESVSKIRRLCTTCQLSTQNDMSARYFPPTSRDLSKILQIGG